MENTTMETERTEFHKYPKITRYGHRDTERLLENPNDIIYVQEKIDGANFRFMPDEEGKITFGSRNTNLTEAENTKGWTRCIDFITSKIGDKDLRPYANCIFYGECCIPHTLKYSWDSIPMFLGFDIMKDGEFLDFEEVVKIYKELDLPMVPMLPTLRAEELKGIEITDEHVPPSTYGEFKAEGIVLKNYRTKTFVKYVRAQFKEVHESVFGANQKPADDFNEKLINVYCTDARVEKMVRKMVDEGNELDMKLMVSLPHRVWDDIVEEHSVEIMNTTWTLNFGVCRKLVAKKCVAVLKTCQV